MGCPLVLRYGPGVFGRTPVAAGLVVLSAIPLTAKWLSASPALMAAVKRYRADFASKSGVGADRQRPSRSRGRSRAVAEMQVTVAQFRVLAEEAISQRVSLRPAVGLDPENAAWDSKHKMA